MAKVTGQNVPPELEAIWNALHAPGKAAQGANGTISKTKNLSKPAKPKRRNLDLLAFQQIAETVALENFTNKALPIPPGFVYNMTQDLIMGIIDTDYFQPCPLDYAQTLQSAPTYSQDLDPPPYGYRTENNWPSVPIYPNGTVTAAAPTYTGQKIGTLFADTLLRWRRLVFNSPNVLKTKGAARCLLRWITTINIDTSSRGSRPMVSLNLRAGRCTDSASWLTTKEPPIMQKTILYWRFKVPHSDPPYYHSFQVRSEVKPLSRILKNSGEGLFTRYVLDAANRPMMGRGFNNNDTVATTFTDDPELWEIKPQCIPYLQDQGNAWTWAQTDDDLWDATLSTATVAINLAHQAYVNLTLHLTKGAESHDITITGYLTGNWNWVFDYNGGDGDGPLPTTAAIRVIDASCTGSAVILHVARRHLSYRLGARGFLKLTINSPTSATVTTIADTPACNVTTTTKTKHDYPGHGLLLDTWDTGPQTIWCWFNPKDQIEQLKLSQHSFSDALTTLGYDEARLSINDVTLSTFRCDVTGIGTTNASLDGYDDAGRLKGWPFTLPWLDRTKTNTSTNPIWNTRFMATSSTDYYAALAQLPDETYYPNASLAIQPVILSARSAAFQLSLYHLIDDYDQIPDPFGAPPDFIMSDRYQGFLVGPEPLQQTVLHEII